MIGSLGAALLVIEEQHGNGSFLSEYWSILTDPAHMAVEFTFLTVIDGLLVGLLWPLIRRFIDSKLRAQHAEFDKEHGIHHHDDHIHFDPEIVRPSSEHPDHG